MMETSLKHPILKWLMLGMAFFASALLGACAPELSPTDLLARAERAVIEGDLSAAEIDIKSALSIAPADPRARRLYGDLFARRMNASAAIEQYDRSLAAEEDGETRIKLAQALPKAGESKRLVDAWESGTFDAASNDPRFNAALATALLYRARLEDAREAMDRALAGDVRVPDNDVEVAAARFALQVDKDIEGAKARLEGVVERDPSAAEALSILGLIASQDQKLEAAEDYFQRAVDANPYRVQDQLQLVQAQIRLGKRGPADSNLASLERQLPKNTLVNSLRGQLLFDEGQYQDAVNIFNQVLSVEPSNLAALLLSANANVRLNELSAARRQFEDYLSWRPEDVQVNLQLAQVYAFLGEPEKAEPIARALLEADGSNEAALTLLANALSSQGMHAESAEVFARLTELQPESTDVQVAMGSQKLVAGDVEAGLSDLESAVERDAESVLARERLIAARLALGDFDRAEEAAEAYLAQSPDNVRAAVYLGRVRLQQRDQAGAREMFDRALEIEPGNVDASGGIAALAVLNDDYPAARAAFERAVEVNPSNVLASLNLAVVLERMGEEAAMEATLQSAVEANPQALEPRIPLARLALSREEPGKAIDMLMPVKDSAAQDARFQDVMARAYAATGQFGLAQGMLDKLVLARPNDPGTLLLAARVAMFREQPKRAEGYLRTALETRTDDVTLRKLLIDSLVAQSKIEEADAEIAVLPSEVQQEGALQALRGRIALSMQKFSEAQPLLEAAYDERPNSEMLVLLTAAEWELGERERVLRRQRDWLADHQDDEIVRSIYATRLILVGENEKATAEYERQLQVSPDNAAVLNNLAWLLRESDAERAFEYVVRADELIPDSAQILDTYALVQVERGDVTAAMELVERALELSDNAADIQLTKARVLYSAGRKSEAAILLDKLIDLPYFAAKAEAQALRAQL